MSDTDATDTDSSDSEDDEEDEMEESASNNSSLVARAYRRIASLLKAKDVQASSTVDVENPAVAAVVKPSPPVKPVAASPSSSSSTTTEEQSIYLQFEPTIRFGVPAALFIFAIEDIFTAITESLPVWATVLIAIGSGVLWFIGFHLIKRGVLWLLHLFERTTDLDITGGGVGTTDSTNKGRLEIATVVTTKEDATVAAPTTALASTKLPPASELRQRTNASVVNVSNNVSSTSKSTSDKKTMTKASEQPLVTLTARPPPSVPPLIAAAASQRVQSFQPASGLRLSS